jgi:hypothetical protein
MTENVFMRTRQIIPEGEDRDLEQVPDELFLDLQGRRETQFLAVSCYSQAVQECVVMGGSCFLVRVRPEMRGLLFSQLRDEYRVYRLYRFQSRPETRLLLTEEVLIRFEPEALADDRRTCLLRYCSDAPPDGEVPDGNYHLTPDLAAEPLSTLRNLDAEAEVSKATPLVVSIPSRVLLAS